MPAAKLTGLDVGRARRLRGGYRVISLRPRTLAAIRRRELLPPLIEASTAAFGTDTAGIWHERLERSWFDRIDRLSLILDPGGQVIGWTSHRVLKLGGAVILYMDTTGVVPGHQRRGLIPALQSREVLRRVLARPFKPLHVVYRTRNPVVWRGLRRRLGEERVAPPLSGQVQAWASELAAVLQDALEEAGDLESRSLIVRGAYAGREGVVYGESEVPRSGDPETDAYFDQHVGPDDALLIIARVTLPAMVLSRRLGPPRGRSG